MERCLPRRYRWLGIASCSSIVSPVGLARSTLAESNEGRNNERVLTGGHGRDWQRSGM